MTYSKAFALALLSAGLAACSGTALKPSETEQFDTHIHADGSKRFTYTVEDRERRKTRTYVQLEDQRLDDLRQPPPGPENSRQRELAQAEWRFYQLLNTKLSSSGYCQKGYIELDADIGLYSANLRGECREGASSEDRQRFPNRQPQSAPGR